MIKAALLRIGPLLMLAVACPALAAAPATEPASDARPACATGLPADADAESVRIQCEIPERYRYDITLAESIGKSIRLHDIAAWMTSDALREKNAFRDIEGDNAGWLTRETDDGVVVSYFVETPGEGYRVVAEATLDYDKAEVVRAKRLRKPRAPNEHELRQLRAKHLVMSTGRRLNCGDAPFNTVVFELDEGAGIEILVFLLSAWTDDAVLGGYHMYRVDENGGRIVSEFSQTEGCVAMKVGDLEKADAIRVAHSSSATPTMIHVFLSLQYRKPIHVLTRQNDLVWVVDAAKISLLDEQDPRAGRLRESTLAEAKPPTDDRKRGADNR